MQFESLTEVGLSFIGAAQAQTAHSSQIMGLGQSQTFGALLAELGKVIDSFSPPV